MNARTQITLDPEMQQRAHAKAAELGISFAEYVRRAHRELPSNGEPEPTGPDISRMFDLVQDGPPTNIARDKDKMIGERCLAATTSRKMWAPSEIMRPQIAAIRAT